MLQRSSVWLAFGESLLTRKVASRFANKFSRRTENQEIEVLSILNNYLADACRNVLCISVPVYHRCTYLYYSLSLSRDNLRLPVATCSSFVRSLCAYRNDKPKLCSYYPTTVCRASVSTVPSFRNTDNK
jgi:hypothetical protein